MTAADEASRTMSDVGWCSAPPHARMLMCGTTDSEDGAVEHNREGGSAELLERDAATARGGAGEGVLGGELASGPERAMCVSGDRRDR